MYVFLRQKISFRSSAEKSQHDKGSGRFGNPEGLVQFGPRSYRKTQLYEVIEEVVKYDVEHFLLVCEYVNSLRNLYNFRNILELKQG